MRPNTTDSAPLPLAAGLTPFAALADGLTRDYLLHHRLCPIGSQQDGTVVVGMAPNALVDGLHDIAFAYRVGGVVTQEIPQDELTVSRLTTSATGGASVAQAEAAA